MMDVGGFSDLFDNSPSVGKTVKAFQKSAENYNDIIALFGGVDLIPSSVMKQKRQKTDHDETGAKRSYKSSQPEAWNKLPAALHSAKISGRGCGSGALSIFPQEIGRSIVLFYSEPGELVVDPFAGHNSRMSLCIEAGRDYFGNDLSKTFMKANFKKAEELRRKHKERTIELSQGDSRKLPWDDNIGDMTITSPPYWDIEYYGDEAEQLGNGSYKEFLDGLQLVMNENFRVLKPGKFAAWFVNDFRKKGKFYVYHMDTIRLAKRAGFEPHDIIVVDFGRGFRDVFATQTIATRVVPKRHEYCLVFRKPEAS